MGAASAPTGAIPVESGAATRIAATGIGGALGLAAAGLGLLVLIGWGTGAETLKGIVPGMIVMIPNTAAGFMLAGTSLWLLRSDDVTAAERGVGRALAVLVLLLGALTFIERVFDVDLGIDLLIFADQVRSYPYLPPGRMATNSAVCFTLAGAALLLLSREPRSRPVGREILGTCGLIISILAIIGYVLGAAQLYTFDLHAGMALLTAISFAILHAGVLLARTDRGAGALLAGEDVAATFTRRLLGATLFVPVLVGFVYLRAREHDVFSPEGGIALLTTVTILLLATAILLSGRVLRRTERAREVLLHRERELRAAAEEARNSAETSRSAAESASRFKTEFLANMSHELRTPLNAIIGYAGLMDEGIGGRLVPAQLGHVRRIRMSAQHLLTLIDQVLTFARLEAGREDLRMREVDVAAVARAAAEIAEPLFLAGGLAFSVHAEEPLPITTDEARVRQILLNLLSNAAKFTEAGEVVLRVERDVPRRVVRMLVSDTGPGIAPENQQRIFEAFWQVDMHTTRRHGGTGLGLSVSLRLARLLGGDLRLHSVPGEGSTFTLELPAR